MFGHRRCFGDGLALGLKTFVISVQKMVPILKDTKFKAMSGESDSNVARVQGAGRGRGRQKAVLLLHGISIGSCSSVMSKSKKLPFFGHLYFVCSSFDDVSAAKDCQLANVFFFPPLPLRSCIFLCSDASDMINPSLVIATMTNIVTSVGRGRSWVCLPADDGATTFVAFLI